MRHACDAQTWCTSGCRKARTFRNDGWTEGSDKLLSGVPHLPLLGFERLAAELQCRGTLHFGGLLRRLSILLLLRVVWEQFPTKCGEEVVREAAARRMGTLSVLEQTYQQSPRFWRVRGSSTARLT